MMHGRLEDIGGRIGTERRSTRVLEQCSATAIAAAAAAGRGGMEEGITHA